MRHRNSVFHDVLKRVPWAAFDGLVAEHGADEGTRSFTSRQHLTALLFAQLSGAASLREIEAAMVSHQGRLYHCGAVAPKRSTFADANRNRDFRVFSGLFEAMLAGASRGLRRKMADAVRLIDSTGLRLAGVGAQWARFSTSVFGVKAHVIYDPDLGRPIYHAVTAANLNDITAAKEMPIEAGATYVFDLGYYDFAFWAKLDAFGCRLVTRFKTNTPLNEAKDMPLAEGSTPYWETKLVSPTGSVCAFSLDASVRAIRRSFQVKRKVMTALAPRPGAMSGVTIWTSVLKRPGSVHRGGFLDLLRHVLDETDKKPDGDGQLRSRMREDKRR